MVDEPGLIWFDNLFFLFLFFGCVHISLQFNCGRPVSPEILRFGDRWLSTQLPPSPGCSHTHAANYARILVRVCETGGIIQDDLIQKESVLTRGVAFLGRSSQDRDVK